MSTVSQPTDADFHREERRSITMLGVLAILVGYRVILRTDSTFKFLGLPLLWTPILDTLIGFWMGYAFCVVVYFSDDLLGGRRGTFVRLIVHRLGIAFLFLYPAMFLYALFAVVMAFYVTDPFSSLYVIFIAIGAVIILYSLFRGIFFDLPRRRGEA